MAQPLNGDSKVSERMVTWAETGEETTDEKLRIAAKYRFFILIPFLLPPFPLSQRALLGLASSIIPGDSDGIVERNETNAQAFFLRGEFH